MQLDGTVGWKICTSKYSFAMCPFNCFHIEWQLITYWKIAISSLPIEKVVIKFERKDFPFRPTDIL